MKKYLLLSSLFLFLAFSLVGQNVKKIPLVEHFSNTRCPICASKSPALNNTLKANEGKLHHITYHPPYPYDDCIFYLANKAGNQGRANYYNVPGTPRAYLNGVKTSGSKLLPEESLASALELSSPVGIIVTEDVIAGNNTMHTAEITLKTLGDKPDGNYKLYVAVVEKKIDYNAPNGETVHHDVFRKFLNFNTSSGQDIALPAKGDSLVLNFNFTIDNNWQEEEIYVLAFVQNDSDKSILNSGT
ncbi:MAG TPA: Omp28-related outer membrane protein, partial [Saprospiraceae bacterium]|nr:Omp28-related outer membrane protein [Saprospiraceae bacterium]